jgi:hypothetical protein
MASRNRSAVADASPGARFKGAECLLVTKGPFLGPELCHLFENARVKNGGAHQFRESAAKFVSIGSIDAF